MKYKTIVSIVGWLILTVGLYLGILYLKMGDDANAITLTAIISLLFAGSLFFSVIARERKEGNHPRTWMIASWCSITLCIGLSVFFFPKIVHGYTVATSKGELRTIAGQFNKAILGFLDNYDRNVKDRTVNYKTCMKNALSHNRKSADWVQEQLGLRSLPTNIADFSNEYSQAFLTMMTNNSNKGTNLSGHKEYYKKRCDELSDVITSWNPFSVVYYARELDQTANDYVNRYRRIYNDDNNKTIFERDGDKAYGVEKATISELNYAYNAEFDLVAFFTTIRMSAIGILMTILALSFFSFAFIFAIPSHEVGPNMDGDIYKKGYKL